MLPGAVRSSITESDRPKDGDLAALKARATTLRSFPPASNDHRMTMIARLFLRFPAGGKASQEEVACYAQDLASFPMWAIVGGITDIITGQVLKSPEFRPSSLQVRAAVEARFKPVREELAQIEMVLGADVVSDDAIMPPLERRKQMAEEARAMMRIAAPPMFEPKKPHPRLASSFDARKPYDASSPLPPLSPEALGKMEKA